eukprot:355626-Chlamydomonas_euryale.AAC.1
MSTRMHCELAGVQSARLGRAGVHTHPDAPMRMLVCMLAGAVRLLSWATAKGGQADTWRWLGTRTMAQACSPTKPAAGGRKHAGVHYHLPSSAIAMTTTQAAYLKTDDPPFSESQVPSLPPVHGSIAFCPPARSPACHRHSETPSC